MIKTLDFNNPIVRTPEDPCRHCCNRAAKAQQRRYERRKAKEDLKRQSWRARDEDPTQITCGAHQRPQADFSNLKPPNGTFSTLRL